MCGFPLICLPSLLNILQFLAVTTSENERKISKRMTTLLHSMHEDKICPCLYYLYSVAKQKIRFILQYAANVKQVFIQGPNIREKY